jgi:hypothetical protein
VNTPLAEEFKNSLKIRIDQRRNKDLTSLLMLLHNGVYPKSNEFFCYSSKAVIKALAASLITRLFPNKTTPGHNSIDELDELNSQSEENSGSNNEYLVLQKCIATFTNPTPENSDTLTVEKELKLLEMNNGCRTDRLQKLYQALLTVKPTSTASERVFSIAGIFCNKLRNRMSPATLNALVFLKYYFLNKE